MLVSVRIQALMSSRKSLPVRHFFKSQSAYLSNKINCRRYTSSGTVPNYYDHICLISSLFSPPRQNRQNKPNLRQSKNSCLVMRQQTTALQGQTGNTVLKKAFKNITFHEDSPSWPLISRAFVFVLLHAMCFLRDMSPGAEMSPDQIKRIGWNQQGNGE